ncbi:MAG: transglutaminase-like domain-containing protein, partial [Blastocatellia bacterium]
SNHLDPLVAETVDRLIDGAAAPLERAKRIYRFVREEIDYSFLDYCVLPASESLRLRAGACLNKSILATALYRRAGIPAAYGIGLVRVAHLISLIDKMLVEVWAAYTEGRDWTAESEAQWSEIIKIRDKMIQGDKSLHVTSCIHVEGRWFEADVTQNNRFMIEVLQADKYFPQALEMWDGTADFGVPDRFYLGEKKRLKYLTRIEEMSPLYDLDSPVSDELLKELFSDLSRRSTGIGIWLGRAGNSAK